MPSWLIQLYADVSGFVDKNPLVAVFFIPIVGGAWRLLRALPLFSKRRRITRLQVRWRELDSASKKTEARRLETVFIRFINLLATYFMSAQLSFALIGVVYGVTGRAPFLLFLIPINIGNIFLLHMLSFSRWGGSFLYPTSRKKEIEKRLDALGYAMPPPASDVQEKEPRNGSSS